jgi:hypothetical protein
MALELIEIKDFPRTTSVTGSGDELIVVSKADGKTYGIKTSDFKAFLGTVQVTTPKPISPTDPAPTLDGVYIPTVTQNEAGTPIIYTNAGGLTVNTAEEGEDYGKAVQLIKNGATWVKSAVVLPKAENKIDVLKKGGMWKKGDQRLFAGQLWEATQETSSDPLESTDWAPSLGLLSGGGMTVFKEENIITGSHFGGDGRYITDNPSSKRTDYLNIYGADYVFIGGRTVNFDTVLFYGSEYNSLGSLIRKGENITIKKEEIPESTHYIGSNLKVGSGNDISNTFHIEIGFSNESKKLDLLENDSLKRERNFIAYTPSDEIRGFYTSAPLNGYPIVASSSEGFSGFLNIQGVYEIELKGFSPSLLNKYFFDKNYSVVGSLTIANGFITKESVPINAKYLAFTVRTPSAPPTGQELVIFRTNEIGEYIQGEDLAKLSQVYRKINDLINGPAIRRQELNGAGTIVPRADDGFSWSGYIPIKQGLNIKIEGIPTGFNSKFFYTKNREVISTYTVNNGIILASSIPVDAAYIGMNYANLILGDGTATAKVWNYVDDLSDANLTVNTVFGIPSIIPVVVGIEANIYTDNIRSNPVNDKTDLFIREGATLTGTKSNPFTYKVIRTDRALQYKPTVVGEVLDMNAALRNINYDILVSRNFQFRSVPENAGVGSSKITLLCGDSQVDPTYDGAKTSFAPFLKDLFEQSNTVQMDFVGTQIMKETVFYGESSIENKFVECPTEGYGGMQIDWFYRNTSPFWNADKPRGAGIDFKNWMLLQGRAPIDTLDYFVFPMGVNDFNAGVSTTDIIARMKTMQNVLWADFPDCKFIIGLVTQGSKYWSMDVRRKWNIEYYDALIKEFEKPEYNGNVSLSAAGLWTDNIFGSRQIRPFIEPYNRIVDSKNLLINKLKQQGLSPEAAKQRVEEDYGLLVKERTLTRWMDEYPGTTDVVHSSWVSAMQQADCYYSTIKYLLSMGQ